MVAANRLNYFHAPHSLRRILLISLLIFEQYSMWEFNDI